ncbi:SDR family NAD(P)-dependent oxidoreductase [Phaeacidiphilus oryzae]|uniref:SDR family NAD(P)-dependent oxidoreductase n=1 Tax=Phaeacidiphilus oryzae TaxID=348818 RepID=UPI001F2D6FD5|nr:SDR family NAD(P)-dependent oxidoreductase [Phaeacidiphilus oryzae]
MTGAPAPGTAGASLPGRPPTALVTGATAGIGAAFARRLAADGFRVVLVARDEKRLREFAASLPRGGATGAAGAAGAEVLAADLSTEAGIAAVEQRLQGRADLPAAPVDLLVNNAGFGHPQGFLDTPVEEEVAMLRVHCEAVLRLTRAALPGMIERGGGRGVINLGSVAAFYPRGTYSASKAWVVNFSESARSAAHTERARRPGGSRRGVNIMALCPGWVRTEFHERADMDVSAIPESLWLDADRVVDAALRDFRRGRPVSVPDARYAAAVAASRALPRRLSAYLAARSGPSPR